jgi:predicted thioesterase
VALVEEATVAAVAKQLTDGQTTVGTRVELDHHAATLVGATVVAEARLADVDGRLLRFDVRAARGFARWPRRDAWNGSWSDRERFLAKAVAKQS